MSIFLIRFKRVVRLHTHASARTFAFALNVTAKEVSQSDGRTRAKTVNYGSINDGVLRRTASGGRA